MKKLVLILSAVVVMIAFAVPAFASDVDVTGELDFGAMTPFDAATAAVGFYNFYVDFTIDVDEYNSVLLEVAGYAGNSNWGSSAIVPTAGIPYYALTTDVGAFFDLPVGLKNTAGRTSIWTNKYEVTAHALERTKVRSAIDPLAWKFEVDADMVIVQAGLGFGEDISGVLPPTTDAVFNDLGVYVQIPGVADMADIEAWYLVQDNHEFKGKIGGSVKVTDIADMISVAGGFMMNSVTETWGFGVGAAATYMDYKLGVSLNGDDVDTLDLFAIDAEAKFGDFGATAGLGMSFAEGADSFQGAEIGVFTTIGAATWRVGYTIADGTGYALYPSVAGPDGGLWVNANVDF